MSGQPCRHGLVRRHANGVHRTDRAGCGGSARPHSVIAHSAAHQRHDALAILNGCGNCEGGSSFVHRASLEARVSGDARSSAAPGTKEER